MIDTVFDPFAKNSTALVLVQIHDLRSESEAAVGAATCSVIIQLQLGRYIYHYGKTEHFKHALP